MTQPAASSIRAVVFDCFGVLYKGPVGLNRPLVDLIGRLKPHYQIGLLSNTQRSFLDAWVAQHNLSGAFDVVLASSETPYIKPQPEIFAELAHRLGLAYSEIMFIDDSPQHTSAAAGLGMAAITYHNPDQLQRELNALLEIKVQ